MKPIEYRWREHEDTKLSSITWSASHTRCVGAADVPELQFILVIYPEDKLKMAPKAAAEQKAAKKTPAEKKPAAKTPAEKKPAGDKKGRKKGSRKSIETYKIYIYKVLKQVKIWDWRVWRT